MAFCSVSPLIEAMIIISSSLCPAAPQKPPSASVPPALYERKGVCPFEGCVYREWTANRDIDLFDRPNGKQVSALKKGAKVEGLDGIVYTVPNKVRIVYPHKTYKVGDVFYTLTYLGEGFSEVWFDGAVYVEDISALPFEGVGHARPHPQKCTQPSPECWWSLDSPVRKRTWWVRIKTSGGLIAWAISDGNFDNQDALAGKP